MSLPDPFASLMSLTGVADALQEAVEETNRVHRRPQALRQPEVISSSSLLRGAATMAKQLGIPVDVAVHVYVVLSPELVDATARTFRRAPLQVIADLDRRAGGNSFPVAHGERLQQVGALTNRVVTHPGGTPAGDQLAPLVVAAEIGAWEIFAARSELVAAVAARACAITTGMDPRGIVVPELYCNRHSRGHRLAQAAWREGDPAPLLVHWARAWTAGAREADGIIASL